MREPSDPGDAGTRTADIKRPDLRAVRTARYIYIEYATGDRELYDLQHDPDELQNIVRRVDPALVRELASALAGLRGCLAGECREADMGAAP